MSLLLLFLEMGGLTEKPTFFCFIFTLWNHIEIFYETKIIWFSAITYRVAISKETLLKKTFRF